MNTLGLQVPPQKGFGPSKPTSNTFLEGTWSPSDTHPHGSGWPTSSTSGFIFVPSLGSRGLNTHERRGCLVSPRRGEEGLRREGGAQVTSKAPGRQVEMYSNFMYYSCHFREVKTCQTPIEFQFGHSHDMRQSALEFYGS